MAENSSSLPTVNRIFIGGLGENVTTNDLKHIFNSLGKVNNVEFVRTNGRDFAYVDFKPESDKSLQKLFSIYNGCKWKGGKLRLEKAKEHYLTRLKREWEQDSVPVPVPELESVQELESVNPKSEKLNLDSMKLNIFFPKLKKIKSLPYKGSGKHKYSFQRVSLSSSLPLHFCDCEEHCSFALEREKVDQIYAFALESAEREKERSVMDSVLSRLMRENEEREREERGNEERGNVERESYEKEQRVMKESEERKGEERESCEEERSVVKKSEEGESGERGMEEREESEEEEDEDMVMNIWGNKHKSEEFMLESLMRETLESKKVSRERKSKVAKEKKTEKQAQVNEEKEQEKEKEKEKEKENEVNEKENEVNENENEENEKEEEKEKVEEEESDGDIVINISSNKSDELMLEHIMEETSDNKKESQEEINEFPKEEKIEKQAQEASINVEKTEEIEKLSSPIKKESETKIQKPNTKNTWFQKSAWRDLVGDSNTNLFSSSSSTNPKSISTQQTLNSNPFKQINPSNEASNKRNESQIAQQNLSSIVPKEMRSPNEEIKKRKEMSKSGESVNKEVKRVVKKVTVGEFCPFMRNEESEKEWNKTKKALSGYMKSNKSESSNKMRGKRGE